LRNRITLDILATKRTGRKKREKLSKLESRLLYTENLHSTEALSVEQEEELDRIEASQEDLLEELSSDKHKKLRTTKKNLQNKRTKAGEL